MSSLQVEPIAYDKEEETLYISKEITLRNKKIITPTIALDSSLITRTNEIANATKGLNEIFRRVETKKNPLKKLVFDIKRQDNFNSRIERQLRKSDPDKQMTICIIEYAGRSYPKRRELEFILDTAYCYSDIVPLLLMPNITRTLTGENESGFSDYQIFMEAAIEFLRSFNKKPIMGVIPRLAYGFMADLVDFYVKNEINAFFVDFECHNPTTYRPPLLACFRTLKENNMLDSSFIYAHNVSSGRFIKGRNVVNAKDVLSFGFGFDAMGRRHRGLTPPKEGWPKLDTLPNKLRLFNKDDYGYYKILNVNEIRGMYPLDSSIPVDIFTKNFSIKSPIIQRCEKLFNLEQLGLEAFRLRHIVKDYKPKEYLGNKSYVKKQDIKHLKRFRDKIFRHPRSQKTL